MRVARERASGSRISLSAALLFYFLSFFFFAISLFLLFRAAQLETARRGVPPAKINTRLRSSPRDSEFSDAVTTCARSSVSSQALRAPTVFIGVRGGRRASRVENFCRTFLRRENLDRISWAKRESEDAGERRRRTSLNRRNPAFKKRNFGRGSPGPSLFPAGIISLRNYELGKIAGLDRKQEAAARATLARLHARNEIIFDRFLSAR